MTLKLYSLVFLSLVFQGWAHPPLQFEYERGFKGGRSLDFNQVENSFLSEEISPRFRLNGTVIPSHYEVELVVILDNDPAIGEYLTAPGKVIVTFRPSENTSVVTLHANLLSVDIDSIKITKVVNPPVQPISVLSTGNDTETGRHFLSLQLDTVLEVDEEYTISIESVAPISTDRNNGLYLSTYLDPATGEIRRQAVTQMQGVHLRQLFPCFDEPDLKATFDVSIIRKANYTALANTQLFNSSADPTRPGWMRDTFERTVQMSTYLFALVISDFTWAEAPLDAFGGKPVRVYGPPSMIERGGGNYSALVAAELLKFFDDYFQVEYPLSKMDSVATPIFEAGAMENYGLNLYRVSLLIYYPDETLETAKDSITSVLAHELAHQNFGNLVTCKWWTNLWLNEGFATYVGSLGVDAVRPEFRSRENIVIGSVQYAMVIDAGVNTHPLLNDALTPNDIDKYFSTITYDKGASISRMTEKFLNESTYQKGLRYYLQDMKYKGAEQDDLFRNLDQAAAEDQRLPGDVTVKKILDSWTLKSGFPLVKVTIASPRAIFVSQEKFMNGGLPQPTQQTLWYVPITLVTQDKPTLDNHIPEHWLVDSVALATIEEVDTSKWIMINQDATGFYRVHYDNVLRDRIKVQLDTNASMISPLSRAQLLDDYFTFAFQGHATVAQAMSLTTYLEQEDHFTVWNTLFKHLRRAFNQLGGNSSNYEVMQSYLGPRVESVLLKIGVEQDADKHTGAIGMQRMGVLDWACALGHPACADYAGKLLLDWQTDTGVNPVHQDIQATIFCSMVANGGDEAYNFIYARYGVTPSDSPVKPRLLNALGCARDNTTLELLLSDALNTSSNLQRSDATTAMQRVAANAEGRDLVLLFLDSNLDEIISVIGNGSPGPVGSVINTLSGYFSSEVDLRKVEDFRERNAGALAPINDTINTYLDTIRGNINWVEQFGNDIIQEMINLS